VAFTEIGAAERAVRPRSDRFLPAGRAAELREGDCEADERIAVVGGDRGGALDHGGGDRVVPGDASTSVDPVRRFGVVVEYGGPRP
jgi:hypothetical protein